MKQQFRPKVQSFKNSLLLFVPIFGGYTFIFMLGVLFSEREVGK